MDASPSVERPDSNVTTIAVYNKHLCKICKPALDYVRGVRPFDSETFDIDNSPCYDDASTLTYRHNTPTLQDSVDEGCFVCRAIRDDLHSDSSWSLSNWCLREFTFHKTKNGIIEYFVGKAVHAYEEPCYVRFWLYRKFDPERVRAFGSPLELSSSNTSFDYLPVTDMTSSPLWELITQWLERCCANHQRCSHSTSTSARLFPTRLVELKTANAGVEARLLETGSPGFVQGPYLTLSHVWGSDPFLTLTSSNMQAFYTKIPVSNLRQTFVDAFTITQKLGFRYIWIDSLCIVQDIIDDWRYESARMEHVYRGSACNIAVSIDPVGPQNLLDRHRNVVGITPLQFADVQSRGQCRCYTSNQHRQFFADSVDGPLNKRGWVLQERLLAPRVIYFGSNQVNWECNQGIACEALPDGFSSDNVYVTLRTSRNRMAESISLFNETQHPYYLEQAYRPWSDIVEAYSKCSLTKEKDKLVALSGIAKEMQRVLNDEYLAGLWKGNLFSELSWGVADADWRRSHRPQKYRAPSWSWASIEGRVKCRPGRKSRQHELAEIRVVCAWPVTDDPTGELIGGYIKLSGILRRITVTPGNRKPEYRVRNTRIFCVFDTLEDAKLDHIDCIVLGSRYLDIQGLLLKTNPAQNHSYQRVGTFSTKNLYGDAFVDILNLPRELFDEPGSSNLFAIHQLTGYDKSESINSDAMRSIRKEIIARTLDYLRSSMETITII